VEVDSSFRDAQGVSLVAGMQRRYHVSPAVHQHVDPRLWQLRTPMADSREELGVVFDRPLDHALLEHALIVLDANGQVVNGQAMIGREDRSWTLEPVEAWRLEAYRLTIDPRLEDLAGNSLTRVFDRDVFRLEDTPLDIARAVIDFRPRTARHHEDKRPEEADTIQTVQSLGF
jgi:hypothetical protein